MVTERSHLREILTAYKALEELLRQEREAIIDGRMKELEALLTDGFKIIMVIEEKTKTFFVGGRGGHLFPEEERVRDEIGQVLNKLLGFSRQNEELMGERWRKVEGEIERISAGEKLIRAYRPIRERNSQIFVKNY